MKLKPWQALSLNIAAIVVFLGVSFYNNSTAGTTAIMWWASLIGGLTGLINVWLCQKESIWNYPIGFINVAAWFYMFYQYRLFADAWLQVFFGVLMAWGWIIWLTKRGNKSVRPTTHIKLVEIAAGIIVIILGTYFWGKYLVSIQDIAPYTDAFIASASVFAQYLLSRKVFENWYLWILIDVVSIGLYFIKGLNPTGIVYIVFLIICVAAVFTWKRNMKDETSSQSGTAA